MKMAFAFTKKLAAAAAVAVMCWAGAAGAQTWEVGVGANSADVTATLSAGTLTISGTGEMRNYASLGSVPWNGVRGQINAAVIEEGVTSIGTRAFSNCANLTSVTIPNTVTAIGDNAFSNCANLTSITIPNGVISIGSEVFWGTGLTSVTIPNSVTSIVVRAFQSCTGLASINVEAGNADYSSIDGVLFNKDQTVLIRYPEGKQGAYSIPGSVTEIGPDAFRGSGLTSVAIPNSVTKIGEWAFWGCTGLTSVTIPGSVASIERFAFWGCTGLTSVTISNGVTSIESAAFAGSTGLTSITIPNSVTRIGTEAFARSGLTSVTIPDSVTTIGSGPFGNCPNLISINVESGNADYSSIDGVLFNKNQTALIQYPAGKQGAYIIPDSVTSIGSSAFSGCAGLTSVAIPNGVTRIGDWTFQNCTGLTSITIPATVILIGSHAFSDCTGLTSVIVLRPALPSFTNGWDTFHGVDMNKACLYVPASGIHDYRYYPYNVVVASGIHDDLHYPMPLSQESWEGFSCIMPMDEVSVSEINRLIPPTNPIDEAAVVPVNVLTSEFTAGPNPVSRSSGRIDFYHQGRRINDGVLTIFDASGNVVNRVQITCRGDRPRSPATPESPESANSRRIIGTWNLTDSRGRPVSEGTYLVRGVLTTVDGKRERVSVVVGIR